MWSKFEREHIYDLRADIGRLQRMGRTCSVLINNESENGKGSCLLDGLEVLIDAAIGCYREELARYLARGESDAETQKEERDGKK